MKRIIIACFLTIILLIVPFTTVARTIDTSKTKKFSSFYVVEPPELFLTIDEYYILSSYIEFNFEGATKEQAKTISQDITIFDSEEMHYKINTNNLTNAIEEYSSYKIIADDELTKIQSKSELMQLINEHWDFSGKIFGNLINKIMELLRPRLGWTYTLFSEGGALFVQGVNLAKVFIDNIQNLNIALLFTTVVNLIVYIPIYYFTESIRDLFDLDLNAFNQQIDEFLGVFTNNLTALIQIVEGLLIALGEPFHSLTTYVSDVGDFIGWIANEDPWKQPIKIKGSVMNLLGTPVSGVMITCRGLSTTTDNSGYFEFNVNPSNGTEDSIPSNSWYGVHNCSMTISKDGTILKQTPTKLSYVFSGGEISWPFVTAKGKNTAIFIRNLFIERFIMLKLFSQYLQIRQ